METAKNAGQLFRLFNPEEFGTNQGISTRYKNTEHHCFTINFIFDLDMNAAFALIVSGIFQVQRVRFYSLRSTL
jgi:hypothetical protein